MRERRVRIRGLGCKLAGRTVVLLAIGSLAAANATGQAPGSFAPTGDMTAPRDDAVAAPLADGRVLVAGGVDPTKLTPSAVVNTAEIYDPVTGTFSPTGSMTVPRADAAAAPLPDGRVLVAGGRDGIHPDQALQSAEIFDPATGSFAPTGDMTVVRNGPVAAPLPDGRVLVAGGDLYDLGSMLEKNQQSAEIFDPATGTFAPTGSMNVSRANAAAAAPLPDGGVLVAGGQGPLPLASAEIYDAATGKFTPTGDMTDERATASAAPLPDGRVLVAGGGGASDGFSAEIFNPVTGTFAATGHMTNRRFGPAAAPLSDGRVLVAGTNVGWGPDGLDRTRSAELFTPDLSYELAGTKLTVSVGVPGTLTAAAAKPRVRVSAAGKSWPSLKRTRSKGRSGRISLKLTPTGKAMRTLKRTGKLKIRVRLSFVPKRVRGKCVTQFSPCYSSSYSIHETRKLRLKVKKRR
jgi:hypothetical protein